MACCVQVGMSRAERASSLGGVVLENGSGTVRTVLGREGEATGSRLFPLSEEPSFGV